MTDRQRILITRKLPDTVEQRAAREYDAIHAAALEGRTPPNRVN